MDIATSAKRLLFCGAFSAGKSQIFLDNGKVRIAKNGQIPKIIKKGSHVTFNASSAGNRPVFFITERCVFELRDGTFLLTEVAPGIDVKLDIIDRIDFNLKVAQDIKPMWEEPDL